MNEQYIIEDTRYLESFKDKSFGGFKKTDVIKTRSSKITGVAAEAPGSLAFHLTPLD